ncbi:hypothetical protein QE152_g31041 [Popillia japonica]|uniref:NADH dehydrogenase subunit 4 n=1 Tax=Popillia japonica TaxID=7064 RepID=A0AAW1JC98_POPJA
MIILIITCNIVVYIAVMINLWKSDVHQSHKKYRIRATVALPFMVGLVWIVMASIMAPVPIISLVGWYLFYIIIPSQGFILFIFLILLDKDTRFKWLELLGIKQGFILFIFLILLDKDTRFKWLELLGIKKKTA